MNCFTRFFMVCLWCIGFFSSILIGQDNNKPDLLDDLLAEIGWEKSDLGYLPKGYWLRFPRNIPYKNLAFDDLFAEPLKIYDYTRTMGNVVEDYLSPEYQKKKNNALYQLVFSLGVDRYLGGFRNYSANLNPKVAEKDPLFQAISQIYVATQNTLAPVRFGKPDSNVAENIREQSKKLPLELQQIVAELVLNVLDAYRWRQIAVRNVPLEKMQRIFQIRDLADTQTDGEVYYPEFDDVMKLIDLPSLYYSALKSAQAIEITKKKLELFVKEPHKLLDLDFNVLTPIGRIVLLGTKSNHHHYSDAALVLDLGGDDFYQGKIGATPSLQIPISLLIDLAGNDHYENKEPSYATQGAGVFGTGILLDCQGNDKYHAKSYAQGVGVFGLGVLWDIQGNDVYQMELSGQGCGYFGIGLNLDGSGEDRYYIYGDGQGMGGVGGIGVLANRSGNDQYKAEPLSSVYNRGDYHSDNKINENAVQGVGMGRRGDGSDGHSWAGGLGAIIDFEGNDSYQSGNWSLGVGYWFGIGVAYDGSGNDEYSSVYFTQGSGAHFAIGTLIDEGGDDRHILTETSGAGLGFGWDWVNALLLNKGGNDYYEAKIISLANAQIRSNAFFIDIDGDDTYKIGKTHSFGNAKFMKRFTAPDRSTAYFLYSKQIAVFIDLRGKDTYLQWDQNKSSKENATVHPFAGNDKKWFQPAKGSPEYGFQNFGIGLDTEIGTLPEFYLWDSKK